MYQDNIVLCGASAYEQKYYFNQDFNALPENVKNELQVMCVLFTEDVVGVLTLEYDENGQLQFRTEALEADARYDDIGSALKIKQLQTEKQDLLEALELYYKVFFLGEVPEEEKGDLTTEAEHLSYDWAMKHYGSEFLFVTDYDAAKRAFYHMRDENGVPQGYDLIWRGCEITTGAQREHRYDILKAQCDEKGLTEDVKFYLEFFKYGCPPHGGFGLGVDRLTMLLVGLTIKEVMFIFRGPNRLNP